MGIRLKKTLESMILKIPFVAELHSKNEKLRAENEELMEYIKEVELKFKNTKAAYRSLQHDYYRDVFGIDLLEEATGEETRIMLEYTKIFRHLEKGKINLAEREQEGLIKKEEEIVVYEYETNELKRIVLPEKIDHKLQQEIQQLTPKKVWVIKQLYNK